MIQFDEFKENYELVRSSSIIDLCNAGITMDDTVDIARYELRPSLINIIKFSCRIATLANNLRSKVDNHGLLHR